MDSTALPFLTVAELSRHIQQREVSPVEVVQAYLDRIDLVDSKLNSYITVCREEALEEARLAEQAIAGGSYLGPMHGIPMAIKDQFYAQDVRTTAGSAILRKFAHDEDATVIANLKKVGAVLLGKLNMSVGLAAVV